MMPLRSIEIVLHCLHNVNLYTELIVCFFLLVCGRVKADIVFLVDESWSIGTNNFGKLKDFLFRIVTYFPSIGPKGTQVGHANALY